MFSMEPANNDNNNNNNRYEWFFKDVKYDMNNFECYDHRKKQQELARFVAVAPELAVSREKKGPESLRNLKQW